MNTSLPSFSILSAWGNSSKNIDKKLIRARWSLGAISSASYRISKCSTMALKDLGINYKRKMREDNMMAEIGFCIKKNRCEKYIGVYISEFRMIILKDWSYHRTGKTVMQYLHKKKFVKYIKAVYVDYGWSRSSGDIEEKLKQILQGYWQKLYRKYTSFYSLPIM